MLMLLLTLIVNLALNAGQFLVSTVAAAPQAAPTASERFDMLVRSDFFAGFAGDRDRLARAMAACERQLSENPSHAEAMVWHGAGLLFQAGEAFQTGDAARGGELWSRGLAEMSRAVALEPDKVGVRIPRGAVLLQASRNLPDDRQRPLLELAVGDYERVLAIQAPYFQTLSEHARAQLLFGAADGWARLGRQDRARDYFSKLVADLPSSPLAPGARQWLATGELPSMALGCVGCHK
jgi:hypothetical protein